MKCVTTLTLTADVRAGLDRLAAAEERSRSQIVDRALRQFLAAQQDAPGTSDHPGAAAQILQETN